MRVVPFFNPFFLTIIMYFGNSQQPFGFQAEYLGGSCTRNAQENYEVLGDYHPNNTPGNIYGHYTLRLSEDEILVGFGWYFLADRILAQNEVWVYSLGLTQWKNIRGWKWGDTTLGRSTQFGVYSPENLPSARGYLPRKIQGAHEDEFLILFGKGVTGDGWFQFLSEIWALDVSTMQFKLLRGNRTFHGASFCASPEAYCEDNQPGGRFDSGHMDLNADEILIMFGQGNNLAITGNGAMRGHLLNDLWAYSREKNQFRFIRGETTGPGKIKLHNVEETNVYHPENESPGRSGFAYWRQRGSSEIFIFAGGLQTRGYGNYGADMWVLNTTSMWYRLYRSYGDMVVENATGSSGIGIYSASTSYNEEFHADNVIGVFSRGETVWLDDDRLLFFAGESADSYRTLGWGDNIFVFSMKLMQFRFVQGAKWMNPRVSCNEEIVLENTIGGRSMFALEVLSKENEPLTLWVNGGYGIDSNGDIGSMDNVFKYTLVNYCFGKAPHDPTACSGHGICEEGGNSCTCSDNYWGEECQFTSCFGVDSHVLDIEGEKRNPLACSSFGLCTAYDSCECYSGDFLGENCEITYCWRVLSNSSKVCNGVGKCVYVNTCRCSKNWDGKKCERENWFMNRIGGFMALFIFLSLGGTVVLVIVVFVVVLTIYLLIKLKRYKGIDDIQIILEEQKMVEKGQLPKLQVEKSSFVIDPKEMKIISLIGSGGSRSDVYKVEWKGTIIAYKHLKIFGEDFRFEEFIREVGVLMNISHPNILRFFGVSIQSPNVGILMEFCPCGDLKGFLRQGEYALKERLRLLYEISSALCHLHSKSIIHRDIKCENVFVNSKREAKLADFGLSIKDFTDSTKTMSVGTTEYIAPELFFKNVDQEIGKYDKRADLFSFSILCWIVATMNFSPYGEKVSDTHDLTNRIVNDNIRPELKDIESVGQWFVEIVATGWKSNPEERIFTFDEISEAFRKNLKLLSSVQKMTQIMLL